jgi:hypothetical protein
MQRYGHGGALLLQPEYQTNDFAVKYQLDYAPLSETLVQDAANYIRERLVWWDVHDNHLDGADKDMSPQLYLKGQIAEGARDDARRATAGAIATVSSLTRVDGLVLLTEGFRVRGFGCEITQKKDPPVVFAASSSRATVNSLRKADAKHWGTRHRSMMRYCYAHPTSIGFVISQDGDVRAVRRVGERLIIWENVRLQAVTIAAPANKRKANKRAKAR